MVTNHWPDLALALARGDAALWLGPDWSLPTDTTNAEKVAAVAWLGVWSESRNPNLQSTIEIEWRKRRDSRLLIDVPDRVEDRLGPGYKLSEICPYFYMHGKQGDEEALTARKRERSRDDKIEELGRLGASVLVITGYAKADSLAAIICREIAEDAPDLCLTFVAGLSEEESKRFWTMLPPDVATRVAEATMPLEGVLNEIERHRCEALEEFVVRVGSGRVDIRPLLQTVPPISQEFIVLTTSETRDPESDEDAATLLHGLLAGRPPWRAMAHSNVVWDRRVPHRELVRTALRRLARSDNLVHCLELPAESGSGLTVLLQHIAFDSARSGHPTLIHRAHDSAINYHLLRQFLTDLYQPSGLSKENSQVPAVLIFDAPSVEADVHEALHDLPFRLERDSRRVLVIRAVPVEEGQEPSPRPAKIGHVHVRSEPLPRLRAELSRDEQKSLERWAASHLKECGSLTSPDAIELIGSWDTKQCPLPLLICLDAILTENLRSAAGFGQHLVKKVLKVLPPSATAADSSGSEATPRGKELERWLQNNFGRAAVGKVEPTVDEVSAIFITLGVLASLRLKVPLAILADLSRVRRDRVGAAVACLEANNLVTTTMPISPKGGFLSDGPHAPVAYYTRKQAVGLRHPGYGRLTLEWLASSNGLHHRTLLGAQGLTGEALNQMQSRGRLGSFPLQMLKPFVAQLNRPGDRDQVEFVADLSIRYLRLAKKKDRTPLSNWQWQNTPMLLEAFAWLNEQVLRASATALHSRGITRYKTCFPSLSLACARDRYAEAEKDFQLAIERARETDEEHPGNIMTSLGLLYLGWAQRERSEHGLTQDWLAVDNKTDQTLRDALQERRDNPYAAFGLARYLLNRCGDPDRLRSTDARAEDLAEAIDLLQREPEAYFADEWDELRREAVELLEGSDAEMLVESLKSAGNELGYALAALRCLHGRIPTEPTHEEQEVEELHQADEVLRSAREINPRRASHLADLLRYAVFSADPERFTHPGYLTRFDLLQRLSGTMYLDQPKWLYDYAMLAFQARHFDEAVKSFARLRNGLRFFEVGLERSRFWCRDPDGLEPQPVVLRIVSVQEGGKGWGRIEQPRGYSDPVPFSVRAFAGRNKNIRVGTTATCFIRLRPAGPFAEPDAR